MVKKQTNNKKTNNAVNNNSSSLFKQLSALYYDPSFPGSFAGLPTFFRHAKVKIPSLTRKDVDKWKEHDLLVAKRSRITKPKIRRSVLVFNPNQIWEGDLVDMSSSNIRMNRNVRYLLLLVDQFTKKLYCEPIFGGTKAPPKVIDAFKEIFAHTTSRPKFIYTDQGSEFIAGEVKKYLNDRQGIKTFTTKDKDIKCSIVERAIRTLKGRLFTYIDAGHIRYLDALPKIVAGINGTEGRTTKIAPDKIDPVNVGEARQNIYTYNERQEKKFRKRKMGTAITKDNKKIKPPTPPPPPKFKVGDYVLIKKEKKTFTKEHKGLWNDQIFQVDTASSDTIPYVYHLKDLAGEKLLGYFNEKELNKIQLPSTLQLEKTTTFRRRIFKSPINGEQYIEIKTLAYHNPISLPLRVFKSRSTQEKEDNSIGTTTFILYLQEQQHHDDQ